MADDRDSRTEANKKKAPTKRSAREHSQGTSSWIMHSLNRIEDQIHERFQRIEQRIDNVEDRLRRIERFVWMTHGALIIVLVIWAVVQFLLSNYQISFTPNP